MMFFLKDPKGRKIWGISEDGNLSGVPSSRVNMQHPPMHLYTSDELHNLLPYCRILELVGSNVSNFEGSAILEEVRRTLWHGLRLSLSSED